MIVAKAALLLWPIAGMVLSAVRGRELGIIWTVCVGYLFLPSSLSMDLPGLPPYGKDEAIALAVMLGLLVKQKQPSPDPPGRVPPAFAVLIVLLVFSIAFTWLTNTDSFTEFGRFRAGLTISDLRSGIFGLLATLVPLYAGMRYLTRVRHAEQLSCAIMILALIYAMMALVEMRLSPQLHTWVYGYFPSSFAQHFRGGYRPVGFLNHGLALGIFLALAAIVVAGRIRKGIGDRMISIGALVVIYGVLLISKNFGAFLIATVILPIVLFLPKTLQFRAAAALTLAFLAFPLLRGAGLVPLDAFVDWVASIDADRAASFETRLKNEEAFIERHARRPVFGWGGWGRARPVAESGADLTLADGAWVLRLVQYGWFGFLTYYGAMTFAVLALWWRSARTGLDPLLVAFALMLAGNYINLLPNSNFSPISWLVCGMLIANVFSTAKGEQPTSPVETDTVADRSGPVYTRFPKGPPRSPRQQIRTRE
ncbi:MAG: hypothetical protein AAGK37_07265 [Pseudomonadota bacterium]